MTREHKRENVLKRLDAAATEIITDGISGALAGIVIGAILLIGTGATLKWASDALMESGREWAVVIVFLPLAGPFLISFFLTAASVIELYRRLRGR